ncbi:hypothetical protein AMK59_7767 [Oryctes borbonicus]|uniref:Histone acetyltransferase type B catalytic subunit n=1 Tax=Oryctes borbonicus TaxID=1629725 RepID=A0A0T6AVJ0_9SCAR|nr:hypothetical protein AMK59_7767 [Oryctes borbonicus]
MTHQIFEDENIYGYQGLTIDIYFAAHSAYCFIDVYYDEILRNGPKFYLEPDNVMNLLMPWFPNNIMTNLHEFKDCVKRDEPDYIYGECVDCFTNTNEEGKMTGFRIINCDLSTSGFKEFHKRFQSLIIMFIDAANFIDLDDPSWRILYLYEECRIGNKNKYCPVGFCSMYLFKDITTIARISQFFIVPFLQRLGLGYKLLDATYNYLKSTINDLEEITVESPNKIFTRMRDNLDISYIIDEPYFAKYELFKGFTDNMLKIARLKYKFSNEQARKVYEILRCYWSQSNPREYEKFMLDVKKHRKAKFMVTPLNLESNKLLQLLQMKQSKSKGCNKYNFEERLNLSIMLQEEVDKFVHTIQSTLRHIQKSFKTQ